MDCAQPADWLSRQVLSDQEKTLPSLRWQHYLCSDAVDLLSAPPLILEAQFILQISVHPYPWLKSHSLSVLTEVDHHVVSYSTTYRVLRQWLHLSNLHYLKIPGLSERNDFAKEEVRQELFFTALELGLVGSLLLGMVLN